MPRILIICGAGIVSGKEVMALELGGGLTERGHSVSFVTSRWNNGDFPARLDRGGYLTDILPIGFISATLTRRCLAMTFEQVRLWPALLANYSRLLRRRRPERVIHTNWHHLLLLLPYLRPDRDLFWVHEVIPNLRQYRRVFGWLARRLGSFVCVSQAVANSLRRIGVPEGKICVIHNGISDPAESHRSIDPPLAEFRIGIVGQVNPWKGHDDLLLAFALVSQKHSYVELHIFGDGNQAYRTDLCRRSAELGVAQRVLWHGYVANRTLIYGGLDVCVIPSRGADPLPLSAAEPGFFGIPAIATRRGGLPEIIESEVNGLLVEPEQPAEIAHALSRLIEDPELRGRLSANARRIAVERFSRKRMVDDFLALLGKEAGTFRNRSTSTSPDATELLHVQGGSVGK